MTKRLAIQLFGHLRSFRKTYQSFYENIIVPNEKAGYIVDIFIHTWDETDHSTVTWHNQDGENRGCNITEEVINFLHVNYKPKKIKIDSQIDVEDYIITEKIAGVPRSFKGIVNVSYTKYMSNQLRLEYEKEHNVHYDYVIMTRPDIMFHQQFELDSILKVYDSYGWEPPKNGLFFGYNLFSRGSVEDKHLLGGIDIIYFATPDVINKAISCYELFRDEKITAIEAGMDFYCFEIFWYKYWISQGLEPIRVKYFQFSGFNIIRNEEEYNLALETADKELGKIKKIKINAVNSIDEDVKFIEPHISACKNSKNRRIRRELLKLLPYFLVKKEIERLNHKIKECYD